MIVEVVVNPVHREAPHALERVRRLCARAGLQVRTRWTSLARPHADTASEAALTVVIGGDGTLREVAGRLTADPAWAGVLLPVPTGTASLFALNAGIRTTQQGLALLEEYLEVRHQEEWHPGEGHLDEGPTGATRIRRFDVGWADLVRPDGRRTGELPFLVTAGLGRSGETVQRTPGWAKARLGAAGYGIGALSQLGAAQVEVAVHRDVQGAARDSTSAGLSALHRVWALEFGLIRRIPWGITVFPHGGPGGLAGLQVALAEAGGGLGVKQAQAGTDPASRDGRPVTGCREWGSGALRLLRRSPAWLRIARAGLRGGHADVGELRLWSAPTARVTASRPVAVHLDGEAAGRAVEARLRVAAGALRVVVPVRANPTDASATASPTGVPG